MKYSRGVSMKKELKRIVFIVLTVSLLIPFTVFGYSFENKEREYNAKRVKQEIYDLYNLYKFIVGSNPEAEYGVIGYNGQCSQVTVNGKTVNIDDYIAGVIKQEMGGNNLQALKAQAIAARSFLLSTKSGSNCSVTNGQSYQAYTEEKNKNSIYYRAAKETSGMVVSRNGRIATTQYQSHPAGKWCKEDASGWHVTFQRFSDDSSSTWVWNGPDKETVRRVAGDGSLYGTEMNYNNGHHFGMSQTIAMYLAKAQGYSYEKLIKTFYGEDITKLSDGVYDGNLSYVDSDFGKIYYYNQLDYGNYYYSANPKSANTYGGTIATHGCGPTSMAIVASSMLNRNISPIETTQKTCAAGGCTSDGSYNNTLGQVLKQQYGLNVKMSGNNQEVLNALGTGKSLVIVLMGPGTFTTGGHYIVLTGVNKKGQVSVADPASRKRTQTKWFSFNTIIEQRKKYANYTIITKS